MTSMTAAGSKLAISVASPATLDVAGYSALSFTTIGQVEQLGAFGSTTEVVNFQPLDGPLQKYKGPSNSGAIAPQLAHDDDDAGQTLLRTAADDKTSKLYTFRVTLPNGARRFFGGRVFGYPETVGAANSMVMANPSIEISTDVIKAPAA
ncbi:phage tail tube protein [uncultured Sphingomonas sp.]|uniref:phage tail tube protein n=1 Tax=uncultured Sphingomonas sp. TaxID=158754 RepID=UPI0025EA6D40|nr:phage tail tube protein [uncultured Sphingomonas sp.]